MCGGRRFFLRHAPQHCETRRRALTPGRSESICPPAAMHLPVFALRCMPLLLASLAALFPFGIRRPAQREDATAARACGRSKAMPERAAAIEPIICAGCANVCKKFNLLRHSFLDVAVSIAVRSAERGSPQIDSRAWLARCERVEPVFSGGWWHANRVDVATCCDRHGGRS